MSETPTSTEQKANRANKSVAMGAAMMAISMVGVAYAAVSAGTGNQSKLRVQAEHGY